MQCVQHLLLLTVTRTVYQMPHTFVLGCHYVLSGTSSYRQSWSSHITAPLLYPCYPLTMEIISNIHHACTLGSNHALFQLLRLIPSLLGMDDMVLGTRISPDMIHVENIESKNGDLWATFQILAFQKQMRVSNNVGLEFIAKGKILLSCWLVYIYLMPYCVLGHMWCLSFSINPMLDWSITL